MKNNILTYGTFDILHIGHINLILKIFNLADEGKVFIGVSSDFWNQLKGKESYNNENIRINKIKETFPKAIVFFENHKKHCEQWLDDYDKYDIDMIIMGSDHLEGLSFLNNLKTKKNKKVNIVFVKRTDGISSTMLKEKIIEKNN